jgi:hypothetical protein
VAIYHLTAAVVSRGNGHSSTAKAAYNARMRIEDERTGIVHDYSRHPSQVLWTGLYTPKDAPEWTQDRAQLWNHVEAFEKHRSAQVARTIEISLPHELTLEQQRYALQDFIRENFTRKGLIADAAIHAPAPGTDDRNVHAHIMFVTRKLDGTEFCNRKADRADSLKAFKANQLAELEGWRASWEKIGNRHLERHGHEPVLDRRTLEAQQIDRAPGIHMGKKALQMEARGIQTDRGDMAREAANQNEAREWIEQRKAESEAMTLDQLTAEQQEREARQAAERADIEAESRPQHREAEPARDKPADPQRMAQPDPHRPAERMIARALDELAQTDPVRFAVAAAAARETHLQRPEQSWTGLPASAEADRRRQIEDERAAAQRRTQQLLEQARAALRPKVAEPTTPAETPPAIDAGRQGAIVPAIDRRQEIEGQARAVMERAEARWKIEAPQPAAPAPAPETAPQRPRVDYLARLRQRTPEPAPTPDAPMQTAEPAPVWQRVDYLSRIPKAPAQAQQPAGRDEPKLGRAAVAGPSPEAIQGPSYEVDSSQQRPQTPEIGPMVAMLAAARDRLAELAGRMERAFAAVIERHRSRHVPAPENRVEDPVQQIRPASRLRPYQAPAPAPEPTPQPEKPPARKRSMWDDDIRKAEAEAAAERLRQMQSRKPDDTRKRTL